MIDPYTIASALVCGLYLLAGLWIGEQRGRRVTLDRVWRSVARTLQAIPEGSVRPASQHWRGQPRDKGKFAKRDVG